MKGPWAATTPDHTLTALALAHIGIPALAPLQSQSCCVKIPQGCDSIPANNVLTLSPEFFP